ncbi:MAG: patatin-like phospholipase family protein [Lachnospiraceae bacterium]
MKIILSISGGGIRGLIPAIILSEIEELTGKPMSDFCDLIAGTSTGGIIACLLSTPDSNCKPAYSARDIVTLYKEFGKTVFARSWLRKALTLDGLIGTKYRHQSLELLLRSYFGSVRLSETTTNLLLPAYQISGSPSPYFFKTPHAKESTDSSSNPYLWECARSTSAANGYFQPCQLGEHTFLDGGIFANNPALCAYAQAKNMYGEAEPFVIISIGTGEDLIGYQYHQIQHWGILQWALPFFRQTSISSDSTINYMLRSLTAHGDTYYRLQASLTHETLKMDDVSPENILRLQQAARMVIKNNRTVLHEIARLSL